MLLFKGEARTYSCRLKVLWSSAPVTVAEAAAAARATCMAGKLSAKPLPMGDLHNTHPMKEV